MKKKRENSALITDITNLRGSFTRWDSFLRDILSYFSFVKVEEVEVQLINIYLWKGKWMLTSYCAPVLFSYKLIRNLVENNLKRMRNFLGSIFLIQAPEDGDLHQPPQPPVPKIPTSYKPFRSSQWLRIGNSLLFTFMLALSLESPLSLHVLTPPTI